MESMCNELDLVKDELEKLKTEYRIKSELCKNLKDSHEKQSLRVEETEKKFEKQSDELKVKCEEIAEATRHVESLESHLEVKESSLRALSSLNEKLRADFEQKVKTLDGENRDLVSTLNELTSTNKELENKVYAQCQQIEGLKSRLLITETKCCEAERMVQEGKEYNRKNVVIGVLEEEKENFRDRLKWKEEQFKHLEEAHNKLRDQFRASELNWEKEKSALVEESCFLQTRLDSQTRAAEDLRARLEMCNNALAHEESKRRSLEVHVSDMESRFQSAFSQFEGETSETQILSFQRDEEIAELRGLLGTKAMVLKEREIEITRLEQENQELRESLKEFQDAQIRNAGTTSYVKLQNMLRRLEKAHGNCSENLREKESELLSKIESIRKNEMCCKAELENKEEEVKKLHLELESCKCKTHELSIETSLILEVLKSELSEAYSAPYNVKLEMDLQNQEKEEKISLLAAQLERKRDGLEKARVELKEERERVLSLTERVNSLELMNQQLIISQEELGEDQETCWTMENSFIKDKTPEILENERREKDKSIEDMLQQIELLESKLVAKVNETEASLQDKINLTQTAKEKELCIEKLQSDLGQLQQESKRRELEIETRARSEIVKDFAEEKGMLSRVITEKEQRIKNLTVLTMSMERDLVSTFASSFQDVVEKQVRIDVLNEALDDLKYVTDREIKEKTRIIADMREEVSTLQERLAHQEDSFLSAKLESEYLQVLMKCKALEREVLSDKQRKTEESFLKKLESDKRSLLQENTKLFAEKESLVGYVKKVCDEVGNFASEDVKMMKALGKMLPRGEEKIEVENSFYGCVGGKSDASFSSKLSANSNERSPLKEVNMWKR